jgi:parallel beta-helix repeat protein
MRVPSIAALALLAGFALRGLSESKVLHVAIDGRDSWSGELARPKADLTDGPLASLESALDPARRRDSAGVRIRVQSGRHELVRTLTIQPEHSGSAAEPVVIEGVGPSKPILSGGTRLTGWRPTADRPGVWFVDLPEVRDGRWYFRQLFREGRRLTRARTPNEGFLQTRAKIGRGSPIEIPFRAGDLRPEWAGGSTELLMLMKWSDLHLPIRSIDTNTLVALVPGGPPPDWMDEPDARYWIENTAEALDRPGEWRIERSTGRVELFLEPGADPNASQIVAPRLSTLIEWRGHGADLALVRHVELRGLTLTDADYALPADGVIAPQAAVNAAGALTARFASDCRIEDCEFTNLGGYGLELGRGTRHWRIVGNELRDLGGGGVRIGEPGGTDDRVTACHSHVVTDNHLHRLGRIFPPACGVIIFRSGTNRVAHNHIHDLFYTGISVGWNWGYEPNACRENRIEFNHVHDLGQRLLSDMGGIYTLGPQPGTVVGNNLFHDIQSYRYGGWGLYTDEGSTGIVMENNVVYRCRDAGFHQHYGRDNVIRNNLLVGNENHSVMRTRPEAHRSFWFTNNVVVASSGALLGSNWKGATTNYLMARNVWFDTRLGTDAAAYRFDKKTWQEWQSTGQDIGSIIADPLLVDAQRPELGLRPGSPAFANGFRPIDLSTVGPRTAGRRD